MCLNALNIKATDIKRDQRIKCELQTAKRITYKSKAFKLILIRQFDCCERSKIIWPYIYNRAFSYLLTRKIKKWKHYRIWKLYGFLHNITIFRLTFAKRVACGTYIYLIYEEHEMYICKIRSVQFVMFKSRTQIKRYEIFQCAECVHIIFILFEWCQLFVYAVQHLLIISFTWCFILNRILCAYLHAVCVFYMTILHRMS